MINWAVGRQTRQKSVRLAEALPLSSCWWKWQTEDLHSLQSLDRKLFLRIACFLNFWTLKSFRLNPETPLTELVTGALFKNVLIPSKKAVLEMLCGTCNSTHCFLMFWCLPKRWSELTGLNWVVHCGDLQASFSTKTRRFLEENTKNSSQNYIQNIWNIIIIIVNWDLRLIWPGIMQMSRLIADQGVCSVNRTFSGKKIGKHGVPLLSGPLVCVCANSRLNHRMVPGQSVRTCLES